jgi:hypothetical protein
MSEPSTCPKCGSDGEAKNFLGERFIHFACDSVRRGDGEFVQTTKCELFALRTAADRLAEVADMLRKTYELHVFSTEPCDGDSCDCISRNSNLFNAALAAYRTASNPQPVEPTDA